MTQACSDHVGLHDFTLPDEVIRPRFTTLDQEDSPARHMPHALRCHSGEWRVYMHPLLYRLYETVSRNSASSAPATRITRLTVVNSEKWDRGRPVQGCMSIKCCSQRHAVLQAGLAPCTTGRRSVGRAVGLSLWGGLCSSAALPHTRASCPLKKADERRGEEWLADEAGRRRDRWA